MAHWEVLDWRRRVSELYRSVREADRLADGHALWIQGRDDLLRTHPASPVPPGARATFPGADVSPYDGDFRFVVEVDRDVEPQVREVATGTDGVVPFTRIGRVTLADIGGLDVWWLGTYGGGVFLPVKDPGPLSYGGGRYLLDTVKGADLGGAPEALVVDLNFAYLPSCAYDEAWACPLAGPGNTVPVALPVGERYRPLG
jgi:uncharacterized protein (DUF1684 family)